MATMAAAQGLMTVLTVATTLYSGVQQSRGFKIQAKAEETNARTREIERKRNLMKSLAMQNVKGAASGITAGTGSSAQAIQMEDISRFELDELTDKATTEQRTGQLRENARTARTSSLLSAAGEVYKPARRVAKRGKID